MISYDIISYHIISYHNKQISSGVHKLKVNVSLLRCRAH